ncbi:DUF6884 domain-containing protein [Natronorubrum sp. A-ect3]|uniref:DUF6884 domain-containing protein n=1 Tax=Natronorubrum sp. A-ect3 TaxID=3242698 RepID=UPI00359D31EF
MSILLVQSCSKSKDRPSEPVEPLELYTGYFFKIIKKAIREGEFDNQIDLCILSAKHGLIDSTDRICYYDRQMDANRAATLQSAVTEELKTRVVSHKYDYVVFNLGSVYKSAIGDLSDLDASTAFIDGDGIGYKGQMLKQVVRGNYASLEMGVKNASTQAD